MVAGRPCTCRRSRQGGTGGRKWTGRATRNGCGAPSGSSGRGHYQVNWPGVVGRGTSDAGSCTAGCGAFAGAVRGVPRNRSFRPRFASPELFLRLDGPRILTRPIKGTRPRGRGVGGCGVGGELWAAQGTAELTMITICCGTTSQGLRVRFVRVPELMRLERYAQVQHLVSTVAGAASG